MHLSGVLESLAASLVWWVLGILVWQAFRFRKFLKTATEKRKERMEDLSNMVAEDHPLYELMRDDLILSIEIEMAAERSSMTTVQFQIVGNWVSFMGTWIYGSLHPGIGINVCLVLNVLTLLANYFLAYQYRKDV